MDDPQPRATRAPAPAGLHEPPDDRPREGPSRHAQRPGPVLGYAAAATPDAESAPDVLPGDDDPLRPMPASGTALRPEAGTRDTAEGPELREGPAVESPKAWTHDPAENVELHGSPAVERPKAGTHDPTESLELRGSLAVERPRTWTHDPAGSSELRGSPAVERPEAATRDRAESLGLQAVSPAATRDPADGLELRGGPAAERAASPGGGVAGGTPSPAVEPTRPAARNAFPVYLAELESPRSRRAMSACLHRLAAMFHTASGREPGARPGERFPWARLRAEHTAGLRGLIGRQTVDGPDGEPVPWSPAYRNLHLSALRGVLRTAWRLGEMSTDDYQRAAAVRNFRGTRLPAGRSVHAAEFTALLAACAADPSPAGTRDAALLAVLYTTGARRAEVAALRREDYDPGERSLRITGKGDKQRIEYVHEGAAALLGAWLAADDRPSGPLFKPVHRSGAVQHRPMTDAAVRNAVVKRRKEASLPPVTPHDFRRTFIGDLLDQGVDLATVQHLVGHASPATTARYDRRPERRRRNAVDKLPFPPRTDPRP